MQEILKYYKFSFGNPPVFPKDFPAHISDFDNLIKVMEYNNRNHGIIDESFLPWAIDSKISYEVILWFIKDFSHQDDQELLWLIDSLLNHYTIYCDESNNCTKFRFKGNDGKLNVDWYNDFVLAGIAFEGEEPPFDIDKLFNSLNLQKNIIDVKLKKIAKHNGEDINRFIDILKSKKLTTVLKTLSENKIYIHWSTQSLLYYALVDIVDSVLEVPFLNNEAKNALYNHAVSDLEYFLSFLSRYAYPNIKVDKIADFCTDFIDWIESLRPYSTEDEFYLELLRQGCKSSKRTNHLLFLTDNTDNLLIEDFVPLYAMRLENFPNSVIHFDKCGIVEENIDKFQISDRIKATYDFLDSKESKWIQIADIIAGLIGALLAFINGNNIATIEKYINDFNDIQKNNLKTLMILVKKSSQKNKYFDHMSCNYKQIESIAYLMEISKHI